MKFNMQNMIEQVQKMQSDMERVKEELNKKIVTADSGGGMVVVTMTGGNDIVNIKISKEIVNQDDIQMLEDLVVAAVNKAFKATQSMVNEEMKKAAPMLPNIPGLNLDI